MTPPGREASGQRIARARRRRGLSQAVLAGLVGRSESWLSQVERGKRGVDGHSVLVPITKVPPGTHTMPSVALMVSLVPTACSFTLIWMPGQWGAGEGMNSSGAPAGTGASRVTLAW
jgi:Helix-turn-helix domain